MNLGDHYEGWSIAATYDVLKIKGKMSWKMDVNLKGP